MVLRHRWFYWAWLFGAFLGGTSITIAALLLSGSLWVMLAVTTVLLLMALVIDWRIEANTSRLELVRRSV